MVEESVVVVVICCDPIAIKNKSGFDFSRFGVQRMRAARMFSQRLLDRLRNGEGYLSVFSKFIAPVQQRRLKDGSLTIWDVGQRRDGDLNPVFAAIGNCDAKVVQFLNLTAESVFNELVREYEVNEGF